MNWRLLLIVIYIFSFCLFSTESGYAQSWDEIVETYEQAENDTAKAIQLQKLAYLESLGDRGKPYYIDMATKLAKEMKDKRLEGLMIIRKGEYHFELKQFTKALEYYQEAILFGQEHEIFQIEVYANVSIDLLYYRLGNYAKAEEYILKALELAQQHDYHVQDRTIFNGLGSVSNALDKNDVAKEYMHKYLNLCLAENDVRSSFFAYNNLGVIYNKLELPDSALYFAKKAYRIAFEDEDDLKNQAVVLTTLSEIYLATNNLDSASVYIDKGIQMLQKDIPDRLKMVLYHNAAEQLETFGDSDSAIVMLRQYMILKDSVYDQQKMNELTYLETEFETLSYQNKIELLMHQNKIRSLQVYGLIILSVLIILILILIYRSYKLNRALSDEKANALKERVDFQKKELSNNGLYIVNQNKVYNGLLKSLKKVSKLDDEEKSSAINSLIIDIQKSLKKSDRAAFELKFKQDYQGFYERIKEAYPELSKRELDLCTYLKLNMSTKEIAALTDQTIRAVEMSRFRLRKKMNLEASVNLSNYISKLF
jgi:tetratricopeptide (TPR) repeat protein